LTSDTVAARLIFGIHAKKHTDEVKARPNKERSLWSEFQLKNLWGFIST